MAVFVGAMWTSVGTEYMGDHLEEQLPPLHMWGVDFLGVPIATRTGGDVYKILGTCILERSLLHRLIT